MASDQDPKVTLLRAAPASRGGGRTGSWTLPPDLRDEAVRRIRTVALLYAATYFLAGLLPPLLSAPGRALLFGSTAYWLPAFLSILDALAVAWLVTLRSISSGVKVYAGLAFEVLGSYGIAAAQYHDILSPIVYRDAGPSDFASPTRPPGGPRVRSRRTWRRSCSRAWRRIPRRARGRRTSWPRGWRRRGLARSGPGRRR